MKQLVARMVLGNLGKLLVHEDKNRNACIAMAESREKNKRQRKVELLGWICYVRSDHLFVLTYVFHSFKFS